MPNPTKTKHSDPSGRSAPEVKTSPAEQRHSPEGAPSSVLYLPQEIEAAKAVLSGKFPPVHCPDYQPKLLGSDPEDPSSNDYFFKPGESVEWYQLGVEDQCCTFLVGDTTREFEKAFADRDPRVIQLSAAKAAGEALKLLEHYAKEPLGNIRLCARICQAVREELGQLVKDYEGAVGG